MKFVIEFNKTRWMCLGWMLCMSGIFCATESMGQECDSIGCESRLNVDFSTEQQVTQEGRYNCANLLRLRAGVPIHGEWRAEIASISTFMTSRESIGDDVQTFSNLDADRIWFALAVCGVVWEHEDKHSSRHALSVGIRNMNEDYFISPVTSFFTNSSCGIFPTISANHSIANYPVASLGAHYRYVPSESPFKGDQGQWAVQASIYNGMGYSHFTGRENVFRFCPKSDGLFGLAQIDYTHKGSQYFLGTSMHYADNRLHPTVWAYAEQSLMPNLTILAAYGHAFAEQAACRNFSGLGIKYAAHRFDLGIFTDYTRIDGTDEWATELTCNIPCNKIISLQPAIHLITTDTHTRCVGLLRFNVSI